MTDDIDITVARSDRLLEIGRAAEALDLLQSDPRTPTDAGALVTVAHCYHRLDRDREAIEAAEAALAIDPDHVGGLLLLALARLSSGLPSEAVAPATRAVQVAPWFRGSHSVMARVMAELGRFPQATFHAHKTMELDPDGPSGWIALCRVQLAQQRWEDAAMSARQALGRDPENDEARVLLSLAQVNGPAADGRAQAMDTLVDTLRDNPDQDAVRQFLIEVALHSRPKPQLWLPLIVLSLFTGGLGLLLILLIWTATLIQLRSSIPPDVRRLIWADRAARFKILAVVGIVAAIWAVVCFALVSVTIDMITGAV